MRRKTEGLTFPADPLAAMRDLQDLNAPAASPVISSSDNAPSPWRDRQSDDQSYGHMTIQEDVIPEINPSVNTESQQVGQMTSHMSDHINRQTGSHTDVQTARVPLRDQIAASVQGAAGSARTVLKTVTIKLDPELDRRIEDHCYQTGRKKQDVIRDGLLLYFEAVEQIADMRRPPVAGKGK
jgi:hypothetical protein